MRSLLLCLLLLCLQSTIPHVTTWYAPFLSAGGYSSEAITYAIHLEQTLPANSFSIVQFAEHEQHAFTQGLPAVTRHLLKSAMARPRVPAIAICHSTPDVWMPNPKWGWAAVPCPPHNAQYTVGRTMYPRRTLHTNTTTSSLPHETTCQDHHKHTTMMVQEEETTTATDYLLTHPPLSLPLPPQQQHHYLPMHHHH